MSGKRKPPLLSSPRGSEDEEEKGENSEYDNVASPNSSTASGPVYQRTPGFNQHAHSVILNSKGKKKKGLITPDAKDVLKKDDKPSTKAKPKREPLPMKLRALPQSFWQQPNVANAVSPAVLFPPLFNKELPDDVTEVRPVTPPEERAQAEKAGIKSKDKETGSRIVTMANPELLFRLFDKVENVPNASIVKRGRPKKQSSLFATRCVRSEDPCMVSMVTDTLLPLLPHSDRCQSNKTNPTTLTMIPLRDGDKSVSLPSLNVDHNYAQLLSELVVKL